MSSSELVTTQHLTRKAIIYIRQSSPHQMFSNSESLQLQYALRQRALELGWSEHNITTIDLDLGTTAASAEHREGFKQLLAEVTLGEVGIILSYDVTRLSRNCSDWYPLLDLCGYKGCLIADRDSVYNPGSANGRLLLGLKGQISEMELHTIRARLTAGILNKAERGELALSLPVGLVRDELEVVHKDPNRVPSTVKRIRLEHRIFQQRSQSHPRQIDGYLTVSQLANRLNLSKHWFYDRIHNGTIMIARDGPTQLYLFPDEPNTLTKLQRLHAGQIQHLRFS